MSCACICACVRACVRACVHTGLAVPLYLARIIAAARRALNREEFKAAADLYDKALAEAPGAGLSESQVAALSAVAGNVHYHLQHHQRARELFTVALRGVLNAGGPKPSATAVELSLKIASCFASSGDSAAAEGGFLWCIAQAQELAHAHPDSPDMQSLYGLVVEEYGMFLSAIKRVREARKQFLEAGRHAANMKPQPIAGAAARCFIHAALCSADLGDTQQVCFPF